MWKNAVIALPEIKILNDNIEQHNMCSCLMPMAYTHECECCGAISVTFWSVVLFERQKGTWKGGGGQNWVLWSGDRELKSPIWLTKKHLQIFQVLQSTCMKTWTRYKTMISKPFLLPLFSIHSYPWIYTSQFSDFPTVLNELTQFKAGTRIQAHTLIKISTLQPKY